MAITLDSFLASLAAQESGGSYTRTNPDSGAYGKYQIMPANWPSWSQMAGLPPNSPQTPENQERVVRYIVQRNYEQYGNWEDVAAVWYSGSPLGPNQHADQNGYPSIRSYVDSVISRAGGAAGGNQMAADGDFYTRYSSALTRREGLIKQWSPLSAKLEAASAAGAVFHPELGLITPGVQTVDNLGRVVSEGEPRIWMSVQDYQSLFTLEEQLNAVEEEIGLLEQEYEAGGGDIDDFIKRADFQYATDPRNVDAENSAAAFAREMDIRNTATSLANNRLNEQNTVQENNTDSFNEFTSTSSFGQVFRAPRTHLPSADDLFNEAVESVRKGLPEVTPRPYYEGGELPASQPSLAELRGSILNQPEAQRHPPGVYEEPVAQRSVLPTARPAVVSKATRDRVNAAVPKWPPERPVYTPPVKSAAKSVFAGIARGWGR